MATTKTTNRTQTTVPPTEPDPQLPSGAQKPQSQRKEAWEDFSSELEKRANEIASQLPSNLPRDRFLNAAIAAVKQNPDILKATPRTLFAAITKAAQDGLLPDGREGVITVYNQKVHDSSPVRYEDVAQWNPMFYGIRKRAKELDGIIIDAQVVYVGDEFEYELGDAPFIKHKPKPRGEKVDASAGVAVYAIFKDADLRIIHREVMWKFDVFDVMNQSRNKGGLMWTTFWTEGWRKTVGRRGAKTVPMSPQLERLITRDDADFVFPRLEPKPQNLPPPPPADDEIEDGPRPPQSSRQPALQISDQQVGAKNEVETFNDAEDSRRAEYGLDLTGFLEKLEAELGSVDTAELIEEKWDAELDVESTLAHDRDGMEIAKKIKDRHLTRVKPDEDTNLIVDDMERGDDQGGFNFDDEPDPGFPGDR